MFTVETAATIWMVLLIAVAAATALFAVPRRPARPGALSPDPRAGERAAAAERAAELSRRRRAEWERAQ